MLRDLLILGTISAISVGGSLGIHHYNVSKISSIHTATAQVAQDNKENKHDINNIKIPNIHRQIKVVHTHSPSLSALQSSVHNNLKIGLLKAFNNCHTINQFNQSKEIIMQKLGNSLSSKILTIVKPQVSDSFSKPVGISDHLTRLYIGYGNPINKSQLPVTVVLQYATPKYDNEAGSGGPETHYSNKQTHYGNTILNLMVNIQTHDISYQSGYNRIDN